MYRNVQSLFFIHTHLSLSMYTDVTYGVHYRAFDWTVDIVTDLNLNETFFSIQAAKSNTEYNG